MPPRAPNPVPLAAPAPDLAGVALTRWIIDTATRAPAVGGLGFTLAGICPADPPPPEDAAALRAWLDAGLDGQMTYMADQIADRLDPQRVLPGARSFVMVADRYAHREGNTDTLADTERAGAGAAPRGRIARYARGRDYHDTIKRRLHRLADALRAAHPTHEFRSFTDTAPVLERRAAQRAGLGWLAKNAMLINPQHGSWLLLGGFLTTLDLPTLPEHTPLTDHCGACTRCIDACPTRAIAAQPLLNGTRPRIDASRCISYLTIEHEGPIAPDLAGRTGDWLFGCDTCQEVCPHNSPRSAEASPLLPPYEPKRATLPLSEVLEWRQVDRSLLTVSAMKRATFEMMRRNAALARGNTSGEQAGSTG